MDELLTNIANACRQALESRINLASANNDIVSRFIMN